MNLIIFPNQLYIDHPGLRLTPSRVVLIEDSLYFGDPHYPMRFHKQKIWLHRATMKRFEKSLQSLGYKTLYLDFDFQSGSLQRQIKRIADSMESTPKRLVLTQPTDFILEKRLARCCDASGLECTFLPDPGFLNQPHENQDAVGQQLTALVTSFELNNHNPTSTWTRRSRRPGHAHSNFPPLVGEFNFVHESLNQNQAATCAFTKTFRS